MQPAVTLSVLAGHLQKKLGRSAMLLAFGSQPRNAMKETLAWYILPLWYIYDYIYIYMCMCKY